MQDLVGFLTSLISEGYLGLFVACFIVNMIPFLSPSNMVLAGVTSLAFPSMGWMQIGLIVAVAATLAKCIHYLAVRTSRVMLSAERLSALDSEKRRVERWGALALFIAAASPVPDDPLIVYVGLTKYSSLRFVLSYFLGKVTVTVAGALIGSEVASYFESAPIVIASIALTALITGFLFKKKTASSKTDSSSELSPRTADG